MEMEIDSHCAVDRFCYHSYDYKITKLKITKLQNFHSVLSPLLIEAVVFEGKSTHPCPIFIQYTDLVWLPPWNCADEESNKGTEQGKVS